ncbi:transposase [Photorhabdus sp. RM96S]|uniref:transposase n=1 Tax=Photorhabdus TaxID=29487 RepID=UPI0036D79441
MLHRLTEQKQSQIEEGRLMSDHVYIVIMVTSKYAMTQIVGFIKGKSEIRIVWTYME